VYVLADLEFWPKLECTSSPCENLDRSWRVRLRLVKISTEVTLHSSSDRESVSHPHLPKLRPLGRCFAIRWKTQDTAEGGGLALKLIAIGWASPSKFLSFTCNRKFPVDYENEVNILLPGAIPIVEPTLLAPDSRLIEHQFQLSARLHSCWKSKTCNFQYPSIQILK
jgi:hypothetical protein